MSRCVEGPGPRARRAGFRPARRRRVCRTHRRRTPDPAASPSSPDHRGRYRPARGRRNRRRNDPPRKPTRLRATPGDKPHPINDSDADSSRGIGNLDRADPPGRSAHTSPRPNAAHQPRLLHLPFRDRVADRNKGDGTERGPDSHSQPPQLGRSRQPPPPNDHAETGATWIFGHSSLPAVTLQRRHQRQGLRQSAQDANPPERDGRMTAMCRPTRPGERSCIRNATRRSVNVDEATK